VTELLCYHLHEKWEGCEVEREREGKRSEIKRIGGRVTRM
jgi:hypothetical protein